MRVSFLFVLLLSLTPSLEAQQESRRVGLVRGQIVNFEGALPQGLTVEVQSLNTGSPMQRVRVREDGSFELEGLETGEYDVIVMTERNDPIHRELAYVGTTGQPLRVYLRLADQTMTPRRSGTISARQLLHPIPSKAAKELRRSQEAFEAGEIPKSIEHLQKAIKLHPDCVEAHNNLGARYIDLGQYESAVTEFQKTIALDPNSLNGQLNLGLTLCLLRRYPEAEVATRRAVQIDPHSIPARYALGQILGAQEKNTAEALASLRQAVSQFPNARLSIARILVQQGAIPEAVQELREYLKSGNAPKRQLAELWLARLTEAPTR